MALFLFVGIFLLYLPTLSPGVVLDDGGELQMLARRLGIAHPTGYPLYLLVGHLFTWLPIGDVAFRVTLFSTVTVALAAILLYLLARELEVGRAPAAAATVLLASSQRVWMHASAAEVQALSMFFVLLILWLLVRWGKGKAPLWLVTLTFGAGLTHHITLYLFAPAALLYLLVVQPRFFVQPRQWVLPLLTLVLPLLLYLYIPVRASHFYSIPSLQGEVLGLPKTVASGLVSPHYHYGGTLNLILALDYSRDFFGSFRMPFLTVQHFWQMLQAQFPLPALAVMIIGAGALQRDQPKVNALLLVGFTITTVAALKFLAEAGEDGDNFIPSYLLLAIWFAYGVGFLYRRARLARPKSTAVPVLLLALLWVLPLWNVVEQLPQAMERRQSDVASLASSLLHVLPEGAVVTGPWSHITPLRYLQRVEGEGQDLWVIHSDVPGTSVLMARAIEQEQPLFTLRPTAGGVRLLPLPMWDDERITHPTSVRLGDAVLWRGYDLELTQNDAERVLLLTLYWSATAPIADEGWTTFVHVIDEHGQRVGQIDRVPLEEYYPPHHWEPELLLADQYELPLPEALRAGRYQLIFGWYNTERRLLWEDGQDWRLLGEFILPTD